MSGAFTSGRRSGAPELMDDHAVDFDTFRDCLADLARVNVLTLAYRPTIGFLDGLRRSGRIPRGRPLSIVDVGSGHGDMLRKVARWAARHRVAVELTGVDRNPWSARAAKEATPADAPITWRTDDVFAFEPTADLVLSSLFAHHLSEPELARFLSWSERTAALGWFVNDLRRSRFSYVGFGAASRLLRMHRFVQHDGPVSIARSFVEADWARSLQAAGVPSADVEVRRRFPFRLCVARVKPA